MADERNERTEYNWSWSGDDASSYRSKYTQGFDPDYVKHTAEREEEQERASQIRREQTARRQMRQQRPSARRARLSAEQEIRTEQSSYREPERTRRQVPDRSETRSSRSETRSTRDEIRSSRGDTGSRRGDTGSRRSETGSRRSETRSRTGNRAGSGRAKTWTAARRRDTVRSRKEIVRRRYLILAAAAAAGLFLILFFANTYTLTIRLSGDDPLYLERGNEYRDPGATAIYKGSILHFGDTEVPVIVSQEINTRSCGTYEVTYHAEHKNLEATATRMVIVPDRTAPVITLDESVNVVRKGDEWKDSFTAIDDQDGDLSEQVEILGEVNMRRDGKYQLTYRVQDSAGNEATANRTVVVSSVAINRPELAKQGDKNVIYLTFDDGPGMYTERLLEILDSHNVKATFFVTDTNPASRDLIGEEYRRGHTIGVHTMTHDYNVIYESGKAFWEDIDQELEIIKEQIGEETPFMRFPGGSSNDLITMNDELRQALAVGLRDRGLKYYDWTIDSNDSDDSYTTDDIYWNMIDQTVVADPKIVLCHDLKRTTVDMIDNYLSWAIENHYVFLPITEETPVVHHVEFG